MLRKLTVENFFSVKDRETLDLVIARNATDPDGRFFAPTEGSDVRIPKAVVLFGANASGKTTVLRAIAFLKNFMRDSVDFSPGQLLPFLPFYADDPAKQVTSFDVEFDTEVHLEPTIFPFSGRLIFRYELELSRDRTRVLREALSYYPLGKRRRLFERIGNQVNSGTDFRLSLRDPVRKKISPNASVLSVLAKFNHEFSVAAFNTLGGIQTNVSWLDKIDVTPESMTKYYDSNTSVFSRLNDEIRKIDLGIKDVILEQTPQGIEPSFHHIGHNQRLGLIFESHGTRPDNFSFLGPTDLSIRAGA